jgi:putative N-acetylmannosamine-6-phosphate epimerase
MHPILKALKGGLIVSCQAQPHSPVYGARFMAAFARCTELGGAVVMASNKRRNPRYSVYIALPFDSARQVVRAGAPLVALNATHRARQGGLLPEALIRRIREELGVLVMQAFVAALPERHSFQLSTMGVLPLPRSQRLSSARCTSRHAASTCFSSAISGGRGA